MRPNTTTGQRRGRRFWLAAAALAAIAAQGGARAEQTLTLLSRVETAGPDILLQDIVGEKEALPDAWRARKVLAAPEPGRSEDYSLDTIAYALQKYPDMRDVVLRGHYNTTVVRNGRPLDAAAVTRAIEDYVARADLWRGLEVQVSPDPVSRSVVLPEGPLVVTIAGVEPASRPEHYTFAVRLDVEGAKPQTLSVPATVVPLQTVWVAARTVARGQTLSSVDVCAQVLPMKSGDAGFVPTEQNVSGFQTDRTLRPGQPLCKHFLRQPVCCERGDQVSVTAVRGPVQIQLMAKAMAAGRRGDTILCLNESSKRRFLAKLVGPRNAVLNLE